MSPAQTEPPAASTPKPPTRVPFAKPPSPILPAEATEPPATEPVIQPDPALAGQEPPASELPAEPPAAAEDDMFGWGQTKSKSASRKGSKAASKAASRAASKAATPKGAETPKPPESTSEEAGAGMSAGSPTVERPKPSSGGQSPLATVPEDHSSEPIEAPPGGFFVVNPDETQEPPPDPPAPAQAETTSFSSFGNPLGGSIGQNLFGAVSGWGFGGKKEVKSKATTPISATPTWGGLGSVPSVSESTGGGGEKKEVRSKATTPINATPAWGGLGSVPSVSESTGGGGGWGAATGNDSGSNLWASLRGGKSANGSAADLLDGTRTTDPLIQDPMENGEPLSFIPLDGPPVAEGQEGEMSWEGGPGFKEPLTVQTDVTAEAGAETAEPTTAPGDSPVDTRGGDGGDGEQGGEEETGDKPAEEGEWPIAVKTKKKKGGNASAGAATATPATQAGGASGGGGEDWATTTTKKKKGKGKR